MFKALGRAMGMGSERAAEYLAKGSKNATKLMTRAAEAEAKYAAKGLTGPQYAAHNMAIRARQTQIGLRYGAVGAGVAALGNQSKNRSSYRPTRPMTQAPAGSGRYA